MTNQSSSQGRADEWGRGGYVPGEQYSGGRYSDEQDRGPGGPARGGGPDEPEDYGTLEGYEMPDSYGTPGSYGITEDDYGTSAGYGAPGQGPGPSGQGYRPAGQGYGPAGQGYGPAGQGYGPAGRDAVRPGPGPGPGQAGPATPTAPIWQATPGQIGLDQAAAQGRGAPGPATAGQAEFGQTGEAPAGFDRAPAGFDQAQAGFDRAPGGFGQADQGRARFGQAEPGQARFGQAGQAEPGQAGFGQAGQGTDERLTAGFQLGPPATGARRTADAKGFLSALFDFSFSSFVTTKIIKVVYVLILALAVISALIYTIIAFKTNSLFGLLTLIIGDPLFIIVVMAFWRLILEAAMVIFRISEDLRAIRERGDR